MTNAQWFEIPSTVREALKEYRWFKCRYCEGIFILGSKTKVTVKDEAEHAIMHEKLC